MAERVRAQVEKTKQPQEVKQPEAKPAKDLSKQGEALKEKMDKVLDEIDSILEENAEEFVASYVQRGGQ